MEHQPRRPRTPSAPEYDLEKAVGLGARATFGPDGGNGLLTGASQHPGI